MSTDESEQAVRRRHETISSLAFQLSNYPSVIDEEDAKELASFLLLIDADMQKLGRHLIEAVRSIQALTAERAYRVCVPWFSRNWWQDAGGGVYRPGDQDEISC